jgi:hypothetical protein
MNEAIEILKRILSRTRRKSNGCLVCYLDLDKNGYSNFRIERRGKKYRVHRLMMHLVKDFDILSSDIILHNDAICSSKACIEIDHLRIGTISENSVDAHRKYGNNRKGKFLKFCRRGHEFTTENIYTYEGERQCVTCRKLNYLRRQE